MVVLLPKEIQSSTDGSVSVLSTLDSDKISEILSALEDYRNAHKVSLWLPKFKFDTTYDLIPPLEKMGISKAFDFIQADFSAMAEQPLFINKVIQKAYIEVDENGSEAAAATAIGMVAGCAPSFETEPIIFRADHPFAFLLVHDASEQIVFSGVFNQPQD